MIEILSIVTIGGYATAVLVHFCDTITEWGIDEIFVDMIFLHILGRVTNQSQSVPGKIY